MDSVAVVKHTHDVKQTLSMGLELIGGFGNIEAPVLIKPNICTMKDGTGHTVTDTEVVKSVIALLLDADDKAAIKIVESDSQSKNANDAFIKFGYRDFCDDMKTAGFNVGTINLSQEPLEKIPFDGLYFKNPELPRTVTKSHYFISVAVAKTHYLAYITGALKNLFGILPRKDKSFYHSRIHDVITDLARIIRPQLNIVDARVGLEDWNGPTTHEIGAFILGRQSVSVDAVMTRIMSLDPEKVRHLINSSKYNLGTFNPSILGESIDSVKVEFAHPP